MKKVKEERSDFYAIAIADIDRAMKKSVDNLLHVPGGASDLHKWRAQTYHLEDSIGELKLMVGNYNYITDGKLRQLENMLREVCFI